MLEPFTPRFFRQLQQLKIHTRRAFLGSRQGTHVSKRRGHGLEFSDFRAYTPGDDFRHIDWGVYGRTDRMYVRQFREEQDLNVSVILDASSSMSHPSGQGKFELAKNLSLALGYVALTDGDTVTFSILGHENSPKYVGPRAINRAMKFFSSTEASGAFDFLTEARAAVARLKIPGKCFVVSDFMFDLETQFQTFDYLLARNFEVAAIQVLAPGELSLEFGSGDTLVIDAESGEELELSLDPSSKREYAQMLSAHVEALEEFCVKRSIPHVLVSSDQSVEDIVLHRLPRSGLLK